MFEPSETVVGKMFLFSHIYFGSKRLKDTSILYESLLSR